MLKSPDFKMVYQNTDTMIFELQPASTASGA
jgi:hypothetical protein